MSESQRSRHAGAISAARSRMTKRRPWRMRKYPSRSPLGPRRSRRLPRRRRTELARLQQRSSSFGFPPLMNRNAQDDLADTRVMGGRRACARASAVRSHAQLPARRVDPVVGAAGLVPHRLAQVTSAGNRVVMAASTPARRPGRDRRRPRDRRRHHEADEHQPQHQQSHRYMLGIDPVRRPGRVVQAHQTARKSTSVSTAPRPASSFGYVLLNVAMDSPLSDVTAFGSDGIKTARLVCTSRQCRTP